MLPTQPHNGELSNENGDSNENSKEATGLNWKKKTTLHMCHAFLYISLLPLHDYNVKMPNFMFSGGHEHKITIFFSFS